MKNGTKKVIIIINIFLLITCIYIIHMHNSEMLNKPLPNVKIKNTKNKNSLAIMVEKSSNSKEYEEYNSEDSNWLNNDYRYKEAKCVDNNGNSVNNVVIFNEENRSITLTTNKTVYCTLYFDKSLIGQLRENDKEEVLSKEILGDMYRYQGLDKKYSSEGKKVVDNNYICFGTTDKSACINNEEQYMYRIIGITPDNELKVIKETILKEGTTKGFQWSSNLNISSPYDGVSGDCDGDKCEWPNATIFKRINGLNAGNVPGNMGNTNLFVNSTEYSYMNQNGEWYNLIADHNWIYGDESNTNDANTTFQIETGKLSTKRIWRNLGGTSDQNVELPYQWSKYVNAKIGLMYMHDYYFTCDIGDINAGKSWLWFLSNDKNLDLNTYNHEWLLPRLGLYQIQNPDNRVTVYIILGYDNASDRYYGATFFEAIYASYYVRPVFYLKNSINISGTGLKSDPYIINF